MKVFFNNHRARVLGRCLVVGVLVTGCGKAKAPKVEAQEPPAQQAKAPAAPVQKAEAQGPLPQKAEAKKAEAQKAEPKKVQEAKAEPAGDRPLYYDRRITPEDLEGRTLREYSLLRNTIFARVGNRFRKTWLDEHFRAQPWYKPQETTQLDRLTPIDKKNVEIIVQAQEALSKKDLERSQEALLAIKERSKHQEIELRLLSARLGKWAGGAKRKDPKRTPLEDPTLLDKTLKLSNLREMSRRDLRILRNMIYARRGREFSSALVGTYFSRMSWYSPNERFEPTMLTATDRKNIRIVKSLEHSLGGPIKDNDHPEDDWMYVA